MNPVAIHTNVTPEYFDNVIRPARQPALLKGLVADWPLVRVAQRGDSELIEALSVNSSDAAITYAHAPHDVAGRFHYTEDGSALNFERSQMSLREFLRLLQTEAKAVRPRAMAAQGLDVRKCLPNFAAVHPLSLLPASVLPRMWISNPACVATHGDDLENLACCGAGRRRFTVFPPNQLANLYLGPFELTPGGTPISMVHLTAPDFERFPRFSEALDVAQVAELEPGDALYIPYQWYHHVEALDPINILVNYWWDPARDDLGSRWDALLHAIIALRGLPADQRSAWREIFDYYVFLEHGDPGAHLPPEMRGILGNDSPQYIAQLERDLRSNLDPSARTKVGPLK